MLEISLESGIAANGISKGLVILQTRTPDSTQSMDLLASIEFDSKEIPAPLWLKAVLVLLGILIPLSVLQLNNYFFARFRMRDIRIANISVKVSIADSRILISRDDNQKYLFEDRNFEYPSSNTDSERLLRQDWNSLEVFTLKTKLPKNPFGEVSGVLEFSESRIGFANEETLSNSDGMQLKAPLNPNGYWIVSALKGAASEVGGKFELTALITVFLNIDPSQAESQFNQLKDQIQTSEEAWTLLAKDLGQSSSVNQNTPDPGFTGSDVLEIAQGAAPIAGWDDVDSPSSTGITGQNKAGSASGGPTEKKKFFGKKKSKKVKESSKESTQAPQVDPDDPWA